LKVLLPLPRDATMFGAHDARAPGGSAEAVH